MVMPLSAPALQHGSAYRRRVRRAPLRVALPWWLQHLARTQGVAVMATLAALFLFSATAYTNPPVTSRRILQLSNATQASAHSDDKAVGAAASTTLLPIPALDQLPDYYNGCEITSLAMLLRFIGRPASLAQLAASVVRDPEPLVLDQNGAILSWGNPNDGFVGSVSGRSPGYGVYHGPIARLLDKYAPNQAVDLTGDSFAALLATVASGRPVIVWTTVNFQPPTQWLTWSTPQGPVRATMAEHAVLLVGYNQRYAFVNNPLTGERAQAVPLGEFHATWVEMGRQAVTVRPQTPPHVTATGRR